MSVLHVTRLAHWNLHFLNTSLSMRKNLRTYVSNAAVCQLLPIKVCFNLHFFLFEVIFVTIFT